MKFLNNQYCKPILIDSLTNIKKWSETWKNSDTQRGMKFPCTEMILSDKLKKQNYHKKKIESAIEYLCNSGYITRNLSNVFISQQGKEFLEKYIQFAEKGFFSKLKELGILLPFTFFCQIIIILLLLFT